MNYLNTHFPTRLSEDSFGGGIQTSECFGLTDVEGYSWSADLNL